MIVTVATTCDIVVTSPSIGTDEAGRIAMILIRKGLMLTAWKGKERKGKKRNHTRKLPAGSFLVSLSTLLTDLDGGCDQQLSDDHQTFMTLTGELS